MCNCNVDECFNRFVQGFNSARLNTVTLLHCLYVCIWGVEAVVDHMCAGLPFVSMHAQYRQCLQSIYRFRQTRQQSEAHANLSDTERKRILFCAFHICACVRVFFLMCTNVLVLPHVLLSCTCICIFASASGCLSYVSVSCICIMYVWLCVMYCVHCVYLIS